MSWTTRRILDTAALAVMFVGTLWGFGVIGTRVQESAGGALSANATLLAPATPAFSIWSLIYALLVAYVVGLWLPSNRRSDRVRRLGWLPAASMVLNGAWLMITQAGWLWLSVLDIGALAAVLGLLMRRLAGTRPAGAGEGILLDGTFGLYLGWVSVATCANVTATLVAQGIDPAPPVSVVLAVIVLVVAALVGIVLARGLGASWGVAAAMAWGLAWIAVGRLTSEPASLVAGVAAAVCAAVVVIAFALARRTVRSANAVSPGNRATPA